MRGASGSKILAILVMTALLTSVMPPAYGHGYLDQSNEPAWTGGWMHMGSESNAQSFTPVGNTIVAIDINIIPRSAGSGDDTITLRVVDRGTDIYTANVLASVSKVIPRDYDGWLHFDLPGISVIPGKRLAIIAEAGYHGWRYGGDTYPGGERIVFGSPKASTDNFFRTYGKATLDTTPPPAPSPISPSNGAAINDSTPTLDWSDVTDPSGVTYFLQVSTNGAFTKLGLICCGSIGKVSTHTIDYFNLNEGTYYWRVLAIDGAGNAGPYSTVFKFTIGTFRQYYDTPPPTIQFDKDVYLTSERALITIVDHSANTRPDATERIYEVLVTSTSTPNGVIINFLETGPDTGEFAAGIQFTEPGNGGWYYLHVSPSDTITAYYQELTATARIAELVISIELDRATYLSGDTVMVSGTVSAVIDGGIPVTIQVINPRGDMYTIQQTVLNADGTYSTSFNIGGSLAMSGIYTVRAHYAGQSAQTTFEFGGEIIFHDFLVVECPCEGGSGNPIVLETGEQIGEITVGQQIGFRATILNHLGFDQPFVYWIPWVGAEGGPGTMGGAGEMSLVATVGVPHTVTQILTVKSPGTHTVEAYLVDNMEEQNQLAPPLSVTISVVGSVEEEVGPEITLTNLRLIDGLGNLVREVEVGEEVSFEASITNNGDYEMPFVYGITKAGGEPPEGYAGVEGICYPGEQKVTETLIFHSPGTYTMDAWLIDNMVDQNLLAEPLTITVRVVEPVVETGPEITLTNLRAVSISGHQVTEVEVGEEIHFEATIINNGGSAQPFTLVVGSEELGEDPSQVTGYAFPGQPLRKSQPLTFDSPGTYTVEAYLFDNMVDQNLLAEPLSVIIRVIGEEVNLVKEPDLPQDFVSGEVLVALMEGVDPSSEEVRRAIEALGGEVIDVIEGINVLRISVVEGNEQNVIEQLQEEGIVEFASKNKYLVPVSVRPSDPDYSKQEDHYDMIKLPDTWPISMGRSEVVVAVLDTGIDFEHPDLVGNIWVNDDCNNDGIDDDSNGFIDDCNGWNFKHHNNDALDEGGDHPECNSHGSHVTGIIAAMNNEVGGLGVAPHVTIMPLKVQANEKQVDGKSYCLSNEATVAKAVDYAVDNGADIINASLGCGEGEKCEMPALGKAFKRAFDNGVLVVVAAGNEREKTEGIDDWQDYADHVLEVSSIDISGELASYSNIGPGIEVSAPGTAVYSTKLGDTYGILSGTSQAAPMVAGCAALLLSADQSLTNVQIEKTLRDSATDIGDPGRDDFYGEGLLDCSNALSMIGRILPVEEPSEEEPLVSVAIKHKKKLTLVSVRNVGDEEIFGFQLKIDDGKIRYVKAKGWDRDRMDQSTVKVETSDRSIKPDKSQIILLVVDNKSSSYQWMAVDQDEGLIASGDVAPRGTKKPVTPAQSVTPPSSDILKLRIIGTESKELVRAPLIIIFDKTGKIVFTKKGNEVEVDLPTGKYKLTIQAEGYKKLGGNLQVKGEGGVKTFELTPIYD